MKTIVLIIAAALMAFAVFGLSRPAHAAQCAPHADVIAGLARNFSETVVAMGIAENGVMIEVFASDDGTWTIVQTAPAGVSCLMASGGAFEQVAKALPPKGIPE